MKFFEASVGTIIARFFLMMAIVIIAGFVGQWWLAIIALPILISAMGGISFKTAQLSKNRKMGFKKPQSNEAA